MLPSSNAYNAFIRFFISFSMPPPFNPDSLKKATVFKDYPTEAMRLSILKLAFFDTSVVPAPAADTIFFISFFIYLSIIIISSHPLVLHIESLCYKMVVSNVRDANWRQFLPLVDCWIRNLLWNLIKQQIKIIEQILLT